MFVTRTSSIAVFVGPLLITLAACGTDELSTRVIDHRTHETSADATGQTGGQVDDRQNSDNTVVTDKTPIDPSPSTSPSPSSSPSPTPPAVDPCVTAQNEFNLKVQPGIEASCGNGGCHGTGSGGLTLLKGNGNRTTNRLTTRTLIMNDYNNVVTGFINKYSSNGHGGGNQSRNLPAANTNEWWTLELNCTP